MEEKGFEVAGLRRRRICVNPQRKPEKNAANITRTKPFVEKSTSPNTIITTPIVMVNMMPTKRHDGVSRRNTKANRRTNAKAEDLHIASHMSVGNSLASKWDTNCKM